MSDDPTTAVSLTPVVVTAAFALITLVLVQGIVVPWAQTRNRARERWEDAVTELSSLVHLSLPRLMREYRAVTETQRYSQPLVGDNNYDQEKLDQLLTADSQRRRDLDDEIGDVVTRMNVFTGRVASFRRNALATVKLSASQRHLMLMTKFVATPARSLDEPQSEHEARWDKYTNARNRFVENLTPFEERMKPPPREPGKWIKAKISLFVWNVAAPRLRSLRRLGRRGADDPANDSSSSQRITRPGEHSE